VEKYSQILCKTLLPNKASGVESPKFLNLNMLLISYSLAAAHTWLNRIVTAHVNREPLFTSFV
jgi:hypothetical protein